MHLGEKQHGLNHKILILFWEVPRLKVMGQRSGFRASLQDMTDMQHYSDGAHRQISV